MPNATEIAIKGAQLQYLKEMLDRAECDWTSHNGLVEEAQRDLFRFFGADLEQTRHMWNQIGFYWVLSRLGERLSALIFSPEEWERARIEAESLLDIFEE